MKHSKLLGSTKNKSCSACKVDPTLAFDHAVLIERYECKASACSVNDETLKTHWLRISNIMNKFQGYQMIQH
jgi:hypothetical protein